MRTKHGVFVLAALLAISGSAHKPETDDSENVELAEGSFQVDGMDRVDATAGQAAEEQRELSDIEKLMLYKIEYFFGVLFFAAILIFCQGKSQNKRIAEEWHQKALSVIKDNFCLFGMQEDRSDMKQE